MERECKLKEKKSREDLKEYNETKMNSLSGLRVFAISR